MDDIVIDSRKNPTARTAAQRAGQAIGIILVTAVTALVVTGTVWALVAMWRAILG